MQEKKRVFLLAFISLSILALGLAFAFLASSGLSLFCPLHRLTGLMCPGCGNTRATLALLHLDFKAMLRFNLLYPLEVFYLARVYFLCAKNFLKSGRFCYPSRPDRIDYICLCAIFLWGIVRNFISI